MTARRSAPVVRVLPWLVLAAGLAVTAHAIEPDSELARTLQAERRQRMESIIARSSEQIENDAVEGTALAAAFRARSLARSGLLQHAEALADISQAIELDPFNAQYYEERARAYLKLREFKAASADLDMALGLDSKRWSAQRDKGRLSAYQGQFLEASSEFSRAFRLSDGDVVAYNALWLDLALRRAGRPGTALIHEIVEQMDGSEWPAPLLRAFRGSISPEEAVRLAIVPDPRKTQMQRCEAYFYVGQLHQIRGEPQLAKAAFSSAVATGVVEYLEYDWALREIELIELGGPPRGESD